jgi:hypothetical protein
VQMWQGYDCPWQARGRGPVSHYTGKVVNAQRLMQPEGACQIASLPSTVPDGICTVRASECRVLLSTTAFSAAGARPDAFSFWQARQNLQEHTPLMVQAQAEAGGCPALAALSERPRAAAAFRDCNAPVPRRAPRSRISCGLT